MHAYKKRKGKTALESLPHRKLNWSFGLRFNDCFGVFTFKLTCRNKDYVIESYPNAILNIVNNFFPKRCLSRLGQPSGSFCSKQGFMFWRSLINDYLTFASEFMIFSKQEFNVTRKNGYTPNLRHIVFSIYVRADFRMTHAARTFRKPKVGCYVTGQISYQWKSFPLQTGNYQFASFAFMKRFMTSGSTTSTK